MSEYVALYRKYRPRVFSDVAGQDHITKVLKSEIMHGSVSHAYLFCGSRGTGKTTCAKILAKAISCENPKDGDPCGECEKCRAFDSSFDIVEMDAASNNGVDNVRDLREKINFLPIEMKRRVYIIDEVHMLSAGAFNALLKTLEEPPEHVMFILATTELNKIPATILSRCKRFDFHRISTDDIVRRLEYVCSNENIGMDKDAMGLIASLATGAMRDALSMLELFVGQKDVTRKTAELSLGVVGNEIVLRLIKQIAEKDCESALKTIYDAYNSSKDLGILCTELGNMLRDLLVMKYASNSVSVLIDDHGSDVIGVLRDVEDMFTPERLLYCTELVENAASKLSRSGLSRRAILEIMVMRLCDSRLSTSTEALLERISLLESVPPSGVRQPVSDNAPDSFLPLEDSVLSGAQGGAQSNASNGASNGASNDIVDIPNDIPMPKEPQSVENDEQNTSPSFDNVPSQQSGAPTGSSVANKGTEWQAFGDLLDIVRNEDMILYSMISDAKAYLDKDVLTVAANTMGYFMLTSDASKKDILTSHASKLLGYSVTLAFTTMEEKTAAPTSFPEF